ncbi:sirohydrochlorin chelatase [Streptomyces sp. 4N509B]|uniref:sirohydrochlorin chelatase n=1 Tax=Streptomyces sp. 4N509B TaxID=3457413 RepID=UPI003FD0D34B
MDPPAPAMLIVAHGSRDPRHAATVSALAARVRALKPAPRVAVSFLEFDVPGVPAALARLHAGGERRVVVLPLLLSPGFHARTDIPAVLAEQAARLPGVSLRQAAVLGQRPTTRDAAAGLLAAALQRRLAEAGLPEAGGPPGDRAATGVVLAAVGTRDEAGTAAIERFARVWQRVAGWAAVRPAYATSTPPRTADAVHALRAAGVRRCAVAPYVIAPGLLPDRIEAGARRAGADVVAPVLGDAPELARLMLLRYHEAAGDGAGLDGAPGRRPPRS